MRLECIILSIKHMRIYSCLKILKYTIPVILLVVGTFSFGFAQDTAATAGNRGVIESRDVSEAKSYGPKAREDIQQAPVSKLEERKLTDKQKIARDYRREGVSWQKMGNLETALTFYQKAAELDPAYAVVCNDLGVLYEGMGDTRRAEDSYLKAIKIDPDFLSPYTNMALICEDRRDFKDAKLYWKKRAELGSLDDPWTEKARQRLNDIIMVEEGKPGDLREQEVISLTSEVLDKKTLLRSDNLELSKMHFNQAKDYYRKGDELTAFREALDAQVLDPSNREIQEFVEKVQRRLLSR